METLLDIYDNRPDGRNTLKARTIDFQSLIDDACKKAIESEREYAIKVKHGGTVCNSYGYEAWTEVGFAVAVRVRIGTADVLIVYARAGIAPANKCTLTGAVLNATSRKAEYRDEITRCVASLFDGRCSEETKRSARRRLPELLGQLWIDDASLTSSEVLEFMGASL